MTATYDQVRKFLRALDNEVRAKTILYVVGGSSITLTLDRENRTVDIDVVGAGDDLLRIAGKESELAKSLGVYIQNVSEIGFAAPKDWRSNAEKIEGLGLAKIDVYAADIHDVILGKLARLEQRDMEDIAGVHERGFVDMDYLVARLNENQKELKNETHRRNAQLAFSLIFQKELEFHSGKAQIKGGRS